MEKDKIYLTNIVLAAGLIIISLLLNVQWLLYISLAVLILSALSQFFAEWIAKIWMGFGKVLGKINATIILSIFFIFILFPTHVIKKLTSKATTKDSTKWLIVKNERVDFLKPW